jgi:hypothetical protein
MVHSISRFTIQIWLANYVVLNSATYHRGPSSLKLKAASEWFWHGVCNKKIKFLKYEDAMWALKEANFIYTACM